MKKIIVSVLVLLLLLFMASQLLIQREAVLNAVTFSLNIWQTNIFPSLFPFFVLSHLLIQYGFIEFVGELCKPMMYHLFRCKGECAFVLIMSLLSGFPSNAKYTRELYLKGILTAGEASKILMFTHFSNPLFILGTVSILFLNNKEVGLLILIGHYTANLVIGLLARNYYPTKEKLEPVSLKQAVLKMHEKRIHNSMSFGQVITNSLTSTIDTLLLILGVVTFFLIITTIVDQNIHLNSYHQSILNGIFEMTQGLKYVSLLQIPLKFKATLSTMILSFGGFSVHVQMMGILSDTKIRYLPFFTARLLHAALASIFVFLIFDFWVTLL